MRRLTVVTVVGVMSVTGCEQGGSAWVPGDPGEGESTAAAASAGDLRKLECADGETLVWNEGGWSCAAAALVVGRGLSGAGTVVAPLEASLLAAGADAGESSVLARADHLHDARYPARDDLEGVRAEVAAARSEFGEAVARLDLTHTDLAAALARLESDAATRAEDARDVGGALASLQGDVTAMGLELSATDKGLVALGEEVSVMGGALRATRDELSQLRSGPVDWARLSGVPADLTDGDADSGGDITAVRPGTGLVGGGEEGSATLALDFGAVRGESGASSQPARSDHLHDQRYDARYLQRTELAGTGAVINALNNPLPWRKLKDVPLGFADGIDNEGTVAAGDGLQMTTDGKLAIDVGIVSTHGHQHADCPKGMSATWSATDPYVSFCWYMASSELSWKDHVKHAFDDFGAHICTLEEVTYLCVARYIHLDRVVHLGNVVGDRQVLYVDEPTKCDDLAAVGDPAETRPAVYCTTRY